MSLFIYCLICIPIQNEVIGAVVNQCSKSLLMCEVIIYSTKHTWRVRSAPWSGVTPAPVVRWRWSSSVIRWEGISFYCHYHPLHHIYPLHNLCHIHHLLHSAHRRHIDSVCHYTQIHVHMGSNKTCLNIERSYFCVDVDNVFKCT